MPSAPEATVEVDEPLAMRWNPWRIAAVIAVLAMALFWAWILSGGPRKANPDYLDDRSYAEAAETRCQTLRNDLDAQGLLIPGDFDDAAQRADELDVANGLVTAMVDDLEAMAPTQGDDGIRLRGWLTDWRSYLADREAYAAALRTNPEARLLLTENETLRDSVDRTIKIFVDVNEMPACATPGDVG